MTTKTRVPLRSELTSNERLLDYLVAHVLAALAQQIRRRRFWLGNPQASARRTKLTASSDRAVPRVTQLFSAPGNGPQL
jgi:hypothetical protein